MDIYKDSILRLKIENILDKEKMKYVEKQDYETAAALRDMERSVYKYDELCR
jgi:protein-arginine kinase activator protein McsA